MLSTSSTVFLDQEFRKYGKSFMRVDPDVDALSQLFQRLELKAQGLARLLVLPTPWGIAVPARERQFNMYSVRQGNCVLQRQGKEPIKLEAGDSALVLTDVQHTVSDGTGELLRPLSYWLDRRATGCVSAPHTEGSESATWLIAETFSLSGSLGCTIAQALGKCVVLRASEEAVGPWQRHLFNMLCIEATTPRPGMAFVYSRLMELFFVEFLRACAGKVWQDDKPNILRALFDPQLLKAVERVHANPEQDWTVASMARSANMSRTAFAVRFAKLTGITPLTYVTQWRMAAAEDLLVEGMTLGEVAAWIGYESDAAFARAFKRHTGHSPGAVKRRSRGQAFLT